MDQGHGASTPTIPFRQIRIAYLVSPGGASCEVAARFPVDKHGGLRALEVVLLQLSAQTLGSFQHQSRWFYLPCESVDLDSHSQVSRIWPTLEAQL